MNCIIKEVIEVDEFDDVNIYCSIKVRQMREGSAEIGILLFYKDNCDGEVVEKKKKNKIIVEIVVHYRHASQLPSSKGGTACNSALPATPHHLLNPKWPTGSGIK